MQIYKRQKRSILPEAPGCLKDGIDGGGRGAVEGRQSDLVVTAVGHQLQQVVAGDDAGGNDTAESSHGEDDEKVLERDKKS